MSNARIVVDADMRRVDSAAARTRGEVKKVGAEAGNVGQQFDKWGRQMAARMVSLTAILGLMRSISEEGRKQQGAAADAAKAVGSSALKQGLAASRLGLSSEQAGALTTPGARSRDEMVGFLDALSRGDQRGADHPMVFRSAALLNSGLYEQDEVMDALRRGDIGRLEAGASGRLANLSTEARAELATRTAEGGAGERAQRAQLDRGGFRARAVAAHRGVQAAESPWSEWGASKVEGWVPGASQLRDSRIESLLQEQNRIIEESQRPSLPRPPE
ncbi:MAG: hypothetical protein H0W48_00535 [Methylibium sp.]|nr:hypothetical protein [Methylibium sp.]